MPSKRFWAKQNPELDYEETVTKTKNILLDFKFNKIKNIFQFDHRLEPEIKFFFLKLQNKMGKLFSFSTTAE